MSEPKNHHLLPRFYLSGFCNKVIHAREEHDRDRSRCRVWVHDRERGQIRERGVKKLSVERHYYSADTPDGGRDPRPEKLLAGIENRVAPIVKRISYGSPISLNERADLALFVALMKFRVSGYRVWAEDYARGNEEDIRSRAFPTPDALREDLRKHGHPEAEDLETVEKVFRDIHSGAYEMQLTKNHMILRMFEITNRVSSLLLRQDWIFAWTTRDDASFATSDDPFLILDRDLKAPAAFLGRVGVASSEATKALPLSQDVCLLIGGSTVPGISHARLERREVRRLNQEQTRHYERWLIARDEALVRRLVE